MAARPSSARIAGISAGRPWSAVVKLRVGAVFGQAGGARALAGRVQVWDSPSYLSQILARKKI